MLLIQDASCLTREKMKNKKFIRLKYEVFFKPQIWINLPKERDVKPNLSNKKSQIKIQEMAFMLVFVFLFFTLVGLFAVSIFYNGIKQQANKIAEEKTVTAITNLADSPEFYCVVSKSNCVDADKLIALINKTEYRNYWSFSSLKVVKFQAFNKKEEDMVKCNWANYPDCDIFIIYDKEDKGIKNERAVSSYVALCRKEYEKGYTYDKCEIARLIAGTEIKNPSG